MDDYSKVTVKIEKNVTIKTEIVDIEIADATFPLSDFVPDEQGNVVEFYVGETRVKESLVHANMSEQRVDDYSNVTVKIEKNYMIKTEMSSDDSDSNIPLSHFIPDERGNVVEFYEGETQIVKPEPIKSRLLGSTNICNSGTNVGRVKSHVCPECNRAFSLKGSLNYHISAVHLKIKKFECGKCARAFPTRQDVKVHLDAVHRKLKKFPCAECDHAFTQQGSLKLHVDTVHKKIRKYTCGECGHSFAQGETLKSHVDTIHKKIRNYSCEECGRTFTHRASLKRHVDVVHKKIKRHVCQECPHAFSDPRVLTRHVNAIHKKIN